MSFSANPFFSNSVLKRCLGDPGEEVEETTTDILWKDTAHKLTVKVQHLIAAAPPVALQGA